jgi:hypothetical protein
MEVDIMKIRQFVLTVVLAGSALSAAVPAAAQVQQTAVRAAEGTHTWARDGWCYVLRGGQWYRTGYYRSFPVANNPNVFDLFENGQFTKRVDLSDPRYYQEMPAANFASTSYVSWLRHPRNAPATAATVEAYVKAWGRWVTLPQIQALSAQSTQPPYNPNNPTIAASVIGGTQSPVVGSGALMNPNTAATLAQYGVTQQIMESHYRNMNTILAPRCIPGQYCR